MTSEGQFIRQGSSTFEAANGGNQLSTTVTGATDLTLAHFVKGLLVVNKSSGTAAVKIRCATGIAYVDNSLLIVENIATGVARVQAQTGATLNGLDKGKVSLTRGQAGYLRRHASNIWWLPNYTATV